MIKIPCKFYMFVLISLLFLSCKENFEPKVISVNSNILVVEGMINTGNDSTIINLSRTVVLANKNGVITEKGATVTVESETNQSFLLPEKVPGKYAAPSLGLNSSNRYRLRIKTAKGQVYLSDFTESKITPPIDSVTYKLLDNGLQLYSNTHDVNNQARYYKWECTETYIFHSGFYSLHLFDGTRVVSRDVVNNNVYTCWATPAQTSYLGSSAKLTQDLIVNNPLAFIPNGSEKFQERYSVLVKQSTLTKEAFEFWEELKKNTESLGSIFDAQPSQLIGNIYCVSNAQEPVIGYISAGTTESKRIFINRKDLPSWNINNSNTCTTLDTIPVADVVKKFADKNYTPVEALISVNGTIFSYTAAPTNCVDCTIRGSNKKPAFW